MRIEAVVKGKTPSIVHDTFSEKEEPELTETEQEVEPGSE